jgi:hypothetical protein
MNYIDVDAENAITVANSDQNKASTAQEAILIDLNKQIEELNTNQTSKSANDQLEAKADKSSQSNGSGSEEGGFVFVAGQSIDDLLSCVESIDATQNESDQIELEQKPSVVD